MPVTRCLSTLPHTLSNVLNNIMLRSNKNTIISTQLSLLGGHSKYVIIPVFVYYDNQHIEHSLNPPFPLR